jgi:hypothetical protein
VRWRHGRAAVALIFLVGCGAGAPSSVVSSPADTAPIPILPKTALPGYVVKVTDLDPTALSSDALDPEGLVAVLAGAGFQAGVERRFTARWKPLTEVEARVLRFRDAAGADAYLAWLGAHGIDMLGSGAEPSAAPGFAGAIAFSHAPCGSCTKDPVQYLTAWTSGRYALTLLLGGPRAGRAAATQLADELNTHVETAG